MIRTQPGFLETLRGAGFDALDRLAARDTGRVVTDHRSSWVRQTAIGPTNVYIKTYDYPTPADRRRGLGRTTCLARSRARREWDALEWLDAKGFSAPSPLLLAEARWLGWLHRALLVTEAWPGTRADEALAQLGPAARTDLVDALRAAIGRWHAAGFRDRNLDLRNLLVDQDGSGQWRIAKIDSPRFRIRPAGNTKDALAAADWARFEAGLRAVAGAGADR